MKRIVDEGSLDKYSISEQNRRALEALEQRVDEGKVSVSEAWSSFIQLVPDAFELHLEWFKKLGEKSSDIVPVWQPSEEEASQTHLTQSMRRLGFDNFQGLHAWSVRERILFWQDTIQQLEVSFRKKPREILKPGNIETPNWLEGASLNIIESCFQADSQKEAIVYQKIGGKVEKMTYGALAVLCDRVAHGFKALGFLPGDAIAIDMPMTVEAVAAYLGIVKAGGCVVSIADSFAADEITTRLRLGSAKAVITQDFMERNGKRLPMYEKVAAATSLKTIVIRSTGVESVSLRTQDLWWEDFLGPEKAFEAEVREPMDPMNVLFSSGTTGDPKAIPWNHTTPIKCAMDAYYHHDVRPGDVVAWPTNLGWMMGPWLIFASLMNRGTIALYYDAPLDRSFGEFIQSAGVNMLGLVPSMVKVWRKTKCMEGLDWSSIRVFSSTGECSNAEDYLYLMYLAKYRPVIEYCGGTEIGGGYVTGTLVQPASPGTFTTPTLGLDFRILDENHRESSVGEVFLIPPSIGLSTTLLNRDHHKVYFEGVPSGPNGESLRRHGDQFEKMGDYYRGQGRVDDTMNLAGIKVSSAEIERVVNRTSGIVESAAIAVTPKGGGPSQLVVCAVHQDRENIKLKEKLICDDLKKAMQDKIKKELNPLFHLHDIVLVESLPRTASNKVMRRVLRANYINR